MSRKHKSKIAVDTEPQLTERSSLRGRSEFKDLFDNAPVGFHEVDAEGRLVRINRTELKMLGYSTEELLGQFAWKLSADEETSRRALLAKLSGEMPPGESFEWVFRRKDGSTFPVWISDRPLKRNDGVIVGLQGAVQDITERKRTEQALRESEDRYAALFNRSLDCVFLCDFEGRFLDANQAALDLLGYQREEISSLQFASVIAAEHLRLAFNDIEEIKATGRQRSPHEFRLRRKDGGHVFVEVVSSLLYHDGKPSAIQGIVRDITGHRRVEKELQKVNRALRLISLCNQEMVRAADEAALLQAICRLAVEAGGYRMAWVGFVEQDEAKTVRPVVQAGFGDGFLDTVNISLADAERGRGPTGTAIRTGKLVYIRDISTDPLFKPWRAEAARRGYASSIALPLINEGRCLGNLTLYTGEPNAFDPAEIELLKEMADDLAYGIGALRQRVERMRAEEKLELRESFLSAITENQPGLLWLKDAEGRFQMVNNAFASACGHGEPEAVHGLTDLDIWPKGLAEKYRADDQRVMTTGNACMVEEMIAFGESQVWHETFKTPVRDDRGLVIGTSGYARDITERKRAEAALRESETRLHSILESTGDGILAVDKTGRRVLKTNRRFAEMWRIPQFMVDAGDNHAMVDFVRGQLTDRDAFLRNESLYNSTVTGMDTLEFKDGRVFESHSFPMMMDGVVTGRVWSFRDITERKRAEAFQARLATAVEQAAESIVITDTGGTILYANPAFEKSSGYTRAEALGQNPRLLKSGKHDAEFYRRLWEVIGRGETWSGRLMNRRKDGGLYEEEATISPVRDTTGTVINYVAVKRDVTREVQLEEQIRQAQKMEAVGQLAGGVAHDFNNILNVIIGYGDLIASELDPDTPLRLYAEELRTAAERAAGLTKQLLVFSRKQKVELVVLDLGETVNNLEKMLRRLIGENIEMNIVSGKDAGCIQADSGYIGQVLMNLAINARDAMPNGGRLTITTSKVTLDESHARAHPGAIPGDYVMLDVSDTGSGMTAEVKAHIFEALFTTKPAGKGTGLGLATCQTIVQQSGGHIEVDSEVGKGTTFSIYFPRVDKPVVAEAGPVQGGSLPRGTETLLVVEDEPSVKNLAANVLAALGYNVLRANNGHEALHLFREHKETPIRLVVTDVIMPRMGGKVMADWLKTTYPELKILFTSGYTDDALAQQGVLEPGVAFLPKPYTPEALARKVRALLDDQTDTSFLRLESPTKSP